MVGTVAGFRVRPITHEVYAESWQVNEWTAFYPCILVSLYITAPVSSQRLRNVTVVCLQNRVLLVPYQFWNFYHNIIIAPDADVLLSPGPFCL